MIIKNKKFNFWFVVIFIIFLSLTISGCKKKDKDKPDPGPNDNPPDVQVVEPERIEITVKKNDIFIGDNLSLDVKVYPEKADQSFTWSILDNKEGYEVAKVENNILTGLGIGKVYLTATSTKNNEIHDSIVINVNHVLLEEEDAKASCIIGAPGEDASTMFNVHYIVRNTTSSVMVTEESDTEFTNAKTFTGDGYYFEDLDDMLEGKFVARNVWHVVLEGLKPNTSYIYKVVNGDKTESDIYHFKTAGTEETNFYFITDNHYYTGSDGTNASAAVSEEGIKNAVAINPNISFVLGAGDRIDTGGNDIIWKKYFNYAQSLKQLPFIDVPGNHEYYFHNTGQRDNQYYANYTAGSHNGAPGLEGSTCWFIYNDVLFIMMDNVKGTAYDSQLNWAANLLETKEYKYSVAVFHCPVEIPNTADYDPKYLELFDKYSLDLVLCGHWHGQGLSKNIFEGESQSNPMLGTSYFRGAFSGVKSASTLDNAINEARGYIITINDKGIEIQTMLANGTLKEKYTINKQKEFQVVEATKEELINSISHVYDETNNTYKFTWSDKFYGNVKKVTVKETFRNKVNNYVVIPSPAYTYITLKDIIKGYDYSFVLNIEFMDGTSKTITERFNNHTSINLRPTEGLVWDDMAQVEFDELESEWKYIIKEFEVYANDKLIGKFNYLDGSTPKLNYTLENLTPGTSYIVKLIAKGYSNEILFSEETTFKTEE